MKLVHARRVLVYVILIALAGKGASKIRQFLLQKLFGSAAKNSATVELPSRLFSKFLEDLNTKLVTKVLIAPTFCLVHTKHHPNAYRVLIPPRTETTYLLNVLTRAGVDFGSLERPIAKKVLPMLITLIPFVYLALTYRMLKKMFGAEPGIAKDAAKKTALLTPHSRISFDDIAGIDSAKRELEEIVDFLRNPAKYDAIGARIPKGVLLMGPSGTGKTLLARAVASEAGVPFLFCSASDFVEMLVGRGAARVRDLFIQASQHERCIIFIDEIDALAKARGGLNSNDEREQTLNQLLTEMDGFESSSSSTTACLNGQVVVIAATNRPQVLDAALCRAGRFDRHVHVGYPDAAGRLAILKIHSRRLKLAQVDDDEKGNEEHDPVDLAQIAESCASFGQFSGAQLATLVNEAALLAVREGDHKVRHRHFESALKRAQQMQFNQLLGGSESTVLDFEH